MHILSYCIPLLWGKLIFYVFYVIYNARANVISFSDVQFSDLNKIPDAR